MKYAARVVALWVAVLSSVAAGCAEGTGCKDTDRDGFGAACSAGPDCDDANQDRIDNCDEVPPPDCERDPTATGCSCSDGRLPRACYGGPAAAEGVGPCVSGERACVGGHWGRCEGDVLPANERCNDRDDDCDGFVDEGVRSPCGGCDPKCDGSVFGAADAPWDPANDPSTDVAREEDGALVLTGEADLRTDVWIANSGEATVSRLDARTGGEKARYRTGADPSRTAVDYRGDAFVANRAFGRQGSVTRIAADEARCVDRDGDRVIQTSTGGGDVLADGADECVVYVVPVGAAASVPRALAIDGDLGLDGVSAGHPWVGLFAEQRVVRLDGEDGSVVAEVATPGVHPYGAAIDRGGALWVTGLEDGRLARIDTLDPGAAAQVVDIGPACDLTYGIAADLEGNVWLGGWACADVLRRSADGVWSRVAVAPSARGVAVDDAGDVWVAHTGGSLTRISPSPLGVAQTIGLAVGELRAFQAVGVAIDLDGRVWAVSREGAPSGNGLAFRIDPEVYPAEGGIAAFEVGRDAYTYSDMTGHALRVFTRPSGWYRHVFAGCEEGETAWRALHWDADVPPGTTLRLSVRRAEDVASLVDEPFVDVAVVEPDASPVPLETPVAGVLEVQAALSTVNRHVSPRLRTIGVEWQCPGPD